MLRLHFLSSRCAIRPIMHCLFWRRLYSRRLLLAFVATGLAAVFCEAPWADEPAGTDKADANVPPALTEYKGRRIARTMHYAGAPWLVRESRQREEEPEKLIAALDLKPGQTVADIGCGNGFYSLRLAKKVGPRGKVLAVDIQQEMLDKLNVRAKQAGARNVRPILGTVIDPKLPRGEVDLALLVDVYHEFSHPHRMLRRLRECLRPDGRLVLVEFRAEDPKVPIKPLHKMSKQQILKEIPPNGFELVKEYDELPWQHVMFFRPAKDGSPGKQTPSRTESPAP